MPALAPQGLEYFVFVMKGELFTIPTSEPDAAVEANTVNVVFDNAERLTCPPYLRVAFLCEHTQNGV